MKTLLFSLLMAGIVPASILAFNFWAIDENGSTIDPAHGATNWNGAALPSQQSALNITFTPLPTHTLNSPDSWSGIDCGTTLAKADNKSNKPQSITADTVGCGQSFWNAFYARRSGMYVSSYDTAKSFVQRCPTDYYAPAAFSIMDGDVQEGGNGSVPECWQSFQQWLLAALSWNPYDPSYFCADVETLAGTFNNGDTGWVATNTATNKSLSVSYWLIHNSVCANPGDSQLYANGRGSQKETWFNSVDTSKVPLDTTIYSLHDLGLDSVLKYATLLGVSEGGPSIITDASAYPNPTGTGTVLTFGTAKEAYVIVNLYDVLGHTAGTAHFEGSIEPGNHSIPLSLIGLPPGTYFARIQTTYGEVQSVKIVKE